MNLSHSSREDEHFDAVENLLNTLDEYGKISFLTQQVVAYSRVVYFY